MLRTLHFILLPAVLFLFERAHAEDLILDGGSRTLSGAHTFGRLELKNGASLIVASYDGTEGSGTLVITAQTVVIDQSSRITADGAGYRGELNLPGEAAPGSNGGGEGGYGYVDSGGGGAHGGDGGDGSNDACDGISAEGGDAYGSEDGFDFYRGSAGGAAGIGETQTSGQVDPDGCAVGGNGGGAIVLYAMDLTVAGTLSANGNVGGTGCNDSSGGGAGGSILISAPRINLSGQLQAKGGNGGATTEDIAGGGGGGRIKVFFEEGPFAPGEMSSVVGGYGGLYYGEYACALATDGQEGTLYYLPTDSDGDGFTYPQDCDPHQPSIYPGAQEVVNGLDDNCNLLIDEAAEDIDDDQDGFTENQDDCQDADPTIYPGAPEIANGLDDDCDLLIDEDLPVDDDLDGFTEAQNDCNDADDTIYPNAPEIVDGKDNDCDQLVDEGTHVYDDDLDGFSEDEDDCDDNDDSVYPEATELEDGKDNDCDQGVDEGTHVYDDDLDGFSEDQGDCNDDDASIYPGALEAEDGKDNDCDLEVDEGLSTSDQDEDGYTEAEGDCDDTNASISPAALEVPDNLTDDDCDGEIDEEDVSPTPDAPPVYGGCECRTGGEGPSPIGSLLIAVLWARRRLRRAVSSL